MLRIRFLASSDYPQGTYFRWHNLAIGLQQLGHEVTVHCPTRSGFGRAHTETRDGVRYRITPTTPAVNRFFDWHLDPLTTLRLAKHVGPSDICHMFQPFPLTCLSGVLQRRKTAALIYDWDDLWSGGLFGTAKHHFLSRDFWLVRTVGWLERRMPRLADGVTTCSQFLANEAAKRGACSVRVVHNGYWPPEEVMPKAVARQKFRLDPDAFYFGYMGRTHAELDWCLDALMTPRPEGRKVRLALCGMAESVIQKLPSEFRGSIDYLGNLTPEDTRVFALCLDCGLLPLEDTPFNHSRFPIKFAEYFAAGAHVVTSSIGEIATLSAQLPGVTLAGITRESWKDVFRFSGLEAFHSEFSPRAGSPLAEKLSWAVLARQLEGYYYERLHLG